MSAIWSAIRTSERRHPLDSAGRCGLDGWHNVFPLGAFMNRFAFLSLGLSLGCSSEPTATAPEPAQPAASLDAEEAVEVAVEAAAEVQPAGESHYPEALIELLKADRVEALAERVDYPLDRPFPLSKVRSSADFIARYSEIFDPEFKQSIIDSRPEQWEHFGWRGRAYGGLWVQETEDRIRAINHESAAEEAQRLALLSDIRALIHPSLKDFSQPLAYLETTKFKIWVEALEGDRLRYAAWSRRLSLADEPDLILEGVEEAMAGSMGGVTYVFVNGDVRYTVLPSGSPKTGHPSISVTQDGVPLLEQEARWVDLAGVLADPLPGPKTYTPTGRETLTAPVSMPPVAEPEWFEAFLEAHGFVLLDRVHTDSLEGDDPVPFGEHPGVTHRWTIGGCNTVEAFWLFASYSHADWFPAPDSPDLTWRALDEDGLEQASMEDPSASEYAWDDLL